MELYDLISDYLNDSNGSLKLLITWFLNEVMEQEAIEQSGAGKHERSMMRTTHRNGYRDRTLTISHGELTLKKPQLRDFPFTTQVFEKYSQTEKAIVNAIVESYIQGVSTRRVEKIISQLGGGKHIKITCFKDCDTCTCMQFIARNCKLEGALRCC